MSAAKSDSTLESRLQALECHFTWDLDSCRSKLLRLRDNLEDIGTEEGNVWLGHIYNLQGFVHHQLGFIQHAQRFFSSAAEAFSQLRKADNGPWLVVNYGNLAWLHHHQGEEDESLRYLKKVNDLMVEHLPPTQEELHPEVCAEKAWTLQKFDKEKKLLAADLFHSAIMMEPERAEWRTSRVLGLLNAHKHDDAGLDPEFLEEIKLAREQDPENSYLAVVELNQRAKNGEQIEDEAHELAEKILLNPVSSYSGIKALLRLYRQHISVDEAIQLAEEALRNYPEERYLKRCTALCYKWKIVFCHDVRPEQSTIDRAVGLCEEGISLYPHSSLVKRLDLTNILAKSSRGGLGRAEQMYQELLEEDLEPADKQLVYNNYARYLNFDRKDRHASIQYHMKAAEIPQQSFSRNNSIKVLERIRDRNRNRMCQDIGEFLRNLPNIEAE